MTYHPKDILKTALFFATKTENHYIRLTKFASSIPKTTPEDVLATEFLLTQGLRFTFDVKHPYRALEGAAMEMGAMARRDVFALPGRELTADRLVGMAERVKVAHGVARDWLKTSALLTDVYFLYAPSQIMMAALMLADRELVDWYMGIKLPSDMGPEMDALRMKVIATLESCAAMLKFVSPTSKPSAVELAELKRIDKKLYKCRNPEKIDLVANNKAAKRDGGEEGVDERIAKKRKMEREMSMKEGDDLFGPEIKKG